MLQNQWVYTLGRRGNEGKVGTERVIFPLTDVKHVDEWLYKIDTELADDRDEDVRRRVRLERRQSIQVPEAWSLSSGDRDTLWW